MAEEAEFLLAVAESICSMRGEKRALKSGFGGGLADFDDLGESVGCVLMAIRCGFF